MRGATLFPGSHGERGVVEIGVLAVQGAFTEHEASLERACEPLVIDPRVVQVRRPEQLARCDAIILPGGESTTMDKLLNSSGLRVPLTEAIRDGMPVLGTCAGAILLSSKGDAQVERTGTTLLGLMDTAVTRNAFGRQQESFEAPVELAGIEGAPFPGVFIRAPAFSEWWGEARPWARLANGEVVGIQQGNRWALAFHPELSPDPRIHAAFLTHVLVRGQSSRTPG